MTDRFDNLSTVDLLVREQLARDEHEALRAAVAERLKADCPLKIDKVYTITGTERWEVAGGKRMLLRYLIPNYDKFGGGWRLSAQGYLRRPHPHPQKIGALGGVFNYKHTTVLASRLDLSTETDPVTVMSVDIVA